MNNIKSDIQYMIHNIRMECVIFIGSEKECLQFIKENNSEAFPLELYIADKNDKHYIKDKDKLEEDEVILW